MDTSTEEELQATPEYFYDRSTDQLLLGKVALDEHIKAGGHPADLQDVTSLVEYLLAGKKNLTQEAPPSAPYGSFNREKAIQDGTFILNLISVIGPNRTMTARLLENAWLLGHTGNSVHQIRGANAFRSVIRYQEAVGENKFHKKSHFDDLSLDDLVEFMRRVSEEEGQKPSLTILTRRAKEGRDEPSARVIRRLIKRHDPSLTFYDLFEMAGYQESTHSWSNERYELWGVDYVWANQGRAPSVRALDYYSSKRRGPSSHGVTSRYETIGPYHDRLTARLQETFQNLFDEIETGLITGALPAEIISGTKSEWTAAKRYIRYSLVDEVVGRHLTMFEKLTISRLLKDGTDRRLEKEWPVVDLDAIKANARAKNFYSAVWPRGSGLRRIEKRKSTVRVIDPTTGRLAQIKEGDLRASLKHIQNNFHNTQDPQVSTYLRQRGKEIEHKLAVGQFPLRLFSGIRSGKEMVVRFEKYELLARLLPSSDSETRLKICILGSSLDKFAELVKAYDPDITIERIRNIGAMSGYVAATR